MYCSFCRFLYVETRLMPEAPLRWFGYHVGPVTWVCVGVGIASVTLGCRPFRQAERVARLMKVSAEWRARIS